jgi:hypothetical protein
MDLYIDKENLISLMKQHAHEMFYDTIQALKRNINLKMNFNQAQGLDSEEISTFLKFFTTGNLTHQTYSGDLVFPKRPLRSNSSNSFDKTQLSSIYLVDDPDCHRLINAGSVVIGGVGSEIDTLSKAFLTTPEAHYDKELRIGSPQFASWDRLYDFITPITDILIIDPYILKNNESSPDILDVNLYKILEILCHHSRVKVCIVIVYNPDHVNYDLQTVRDNIKNRLAPLLEKQPCVTLISTYKEHDRTIITNYRRITGNTFAYWDSRGRRITKGKEIWIRSLARRDYHENMLEAIEDIQSIIDNAPDDKSFFGDRESNFLNF